jgi:hypothetical protein
MDRSIWPDAKKRQIYGAHPAGLSGRKGGKRARLRRGAQKKEALPHAL